MEIEKVNENKIKITLSNSDLKDFDIDFNSIAYNSPKAQEFFWDVMEKVECKYGLELENSHFFIEAKASSNDTLIIFVTRVNHVQENLPNSPKTKKKIRKNKNKEIINNSLKLIYKTNNIDTFCNSVKITKNYYNAKSWLYKYKNYYYIVLLSSGIEPENLRTFDIMFNEYNEKVSNVSITHGILEEYGKKLIDKNAFNVFEKYFA